MLALLPILFERPGWLVLLLLIIPCFWIARRSIGGLSRAKATFTFAMRVVIIILLTAAIAHPVWEKRGEGLTVTILLDRSQSIPLPLKASSLAMLKKAVEAKENTDDRVAVITIAKDANIQAMPDTYAAVAVGGDEGDLTATNLASGVNMALAIGPADTANRIVLVSDGNETDDSVLQAAQLATANNVPIDVILLEYEHKNEVIFEKIIAPARARKGSSVDLKLLLRSQSDTTGTLRLKMNGEPVDLDPDAEGDGLRITLPGGRADPIRVPMSLETPGPMQFDAVFEPDNPADDEIERNNSAVAVTFVAGQGKVLIIDDGSGESEYLARALRESDITVEIRGPEYLATGPVQMAGYDAIILANIPRFSLNEDEEKMLHAYVHDLGGGFVMLGGDKSFGAGGWIGSEIAKLLPVKLDPPQTRQMTRGALALIMHSCEMPQGNFWGQKLAIAAIEALSSQDYVGICVFGWGGAAAGGINGAAWAFPMSIVGDKSAPIAAAKQMTVGDMSDFNASMQVAFNGLMSVRAGQRHAIIITDGDPAGAPASLINQYISNKITVSTIIVAGHGSPADAAKMKSIADQTGGTFYNIKNPKALPQIFIKEATLVSRSLIQEDHYEPRIASRLPGPIEGFGQVPSIEGYVLTAAREGLAQIPIVIDTKEGPDPVYAYWNYGLGRSIAYTSDLTGKWGGAWASWPQFRAFWEQSIRWVMRPASPATFDVKTHQEGERAIIDVEALDLNASFLNFLQTHAVVLRPDNTAEPLPLQQVGPGRYRGEFKTTDAGAYLININYAMGSGEDALGKGNLQAAVCVPYAREFKAVTHNRPLLQELADKTKGTLYTSIDAANLFNAQNLEIPKSPREIWDLLAIIAACLFLLDVAARRVSVDPNAIAAMLRRATGRRAEATDQTVAAWKRAKSQVAHRAPQSKKKKPTEDLADRAAKFEAADDDKKHSFDVGGEVPQDMRTNPQTPTALPTKPDDKPQDEGDYTSRLLAAKRRARKDDSDSTPKKE